VDTEMTARGVENIVARTGISADEARTALEGMSPQNRMVTAEDHWNRSATARGEAACIAQPLSLARVGLTSRINTLAPGSVHERAFP